MLVKKSFFLRWPSFTKLLNNDLEIVNFMQFHQSFISQMSLKNWLNRVSNVLRNKNLYLSFQTLLLVIDQSNREESRVIHYKRSVTTQHKRQTRRPIKASITPPCRSRVIHKWCLKGDREGGNHTIDYYRSISHVLNFLLKWFS